ncbi:MFS transporter [Variovorax paradoxus]|nr:MFS transporter [Variovorax paradoxus]MBT2304659.1 MFS transporter [Variovorax paradoxus]
MSKGLTILFAVAGGFAVGNLYWTQPLLARIAETLGVTPAAAGFLVTVTQLGYAAGVLLVVPLGDAVDRRQLIAAILTCSALALAACAVAPTFPVLLATLAAVGLTTVTGQILVPLAGDLAREDQRGAVVGTVASGMLTGILASRTISGLVADAFGWRAIYVMAASATMVVLVLLLRALPALPPRAQVPYSRLLGSVFTTVRAHRAVQATLVIGAAVFAAFSLFWTGLTFLLSAPPFSYSLSNIGFVGLAGLAGALAARRAGRLHDRGLSVPATGGALALALASLAMAGFGEGSIIAILVAVVIFDAAIQSVNVLNQTRLLAVDPAARSRLNAAFVTSNFMGGGFGSTVAGILWQHGRWTSVMLCGGILLVFAMLVWMSQRGALATQLPTSPR